MADVQTDPLHRVKVIWGEDDAPWVIDATGDEPGDEEHQFVADIPEEKWQALRAAEKEHYRLNAEIVSLIGVEDDETRLTECCSAWTGYVTPPFHGYDIELAASGSENEWPLHDVRITGASDPEKAQAIIDALPEVFYVHHYGAKLSPVRRDRLSIKPTGWPGSTSSCYRCGWQRDEHADPGVERESDIRKLAERLTKNGEEFSDGEGERDHR